MAGFHIHDRCQIATIIEIESEKAILVTTIAVEWFLRNQNDH